MTRISASRLHAEQRRLLRRRRHRLKVLLGLRRVHPGGVEHGVQRRVLGAQAVLVQARALGDREREQRVCSADGIAVDHPQPHDPQHRPVAEPGGERVGEAARVAIEREQALGGHVARAAHRLGEAAQLGPALEQPPGLHERAAALLAADVARALEVLERLRRGARLTP